MLQHPHMKRQQHPPRGGREVRSQLAKGASPRSLLTAPHSRVETFLADPRPAAQDDPYISRNACVHFSCHFYELEDLYMMPQARSNTNTAASEGGGLLVADDYGGDYVDDFNKGLDVLDVCEVCPQCYFYGFGDSVMTCDDFKSASDDVDYSDYLGWPKSIHLNSKFEACSTFCYPKFNAESMLALTHEKQSRALVQSRSNGVILPEEKTPYQRFGHTTKVDQAGLGVFVGANKNNRLGTIYKYCYDDIAESFKQVAKLSMPPLDNRGYGLSFDSEQGHLLVGSPFDKANSGSVFVYYSDPESCTGAGYDSVAKDANRIFPSDEGGGKKFGSSVALTVPSQSPSPDTDSSVPTAIIGAPSDSTNAPEAGSAYIFTYSDDSKAWVEVAKLIPVEAYQSASFGSSVNINDKWILVAAPGDNYTFEVAGSVYMYSNEAPYTAFSILFPREPFAFARFGSSTALLGNTVFVSATTEDTRGWVYVFSNAKNKWTQDAILKAPAESSSFDEFGWSISALSQSDKSSIVFIGAPNSKTITDEKNCHVGNVFAFGLMDSNWNYLGVFDSPVPSADDLVVYDDENKDGNDNCLSDRYGSSLAYISNFGGEKSLDQVFIGAELANFESQKIGEVYAESNLVDIYFNLNLQKAIPINQGGSSDSKSGGRFPSSLSYSVLAVVVVLMALPLLVMTGFLVKRTIHRAKQAREERTDQTESINPIISSAKVDENDSRMTSDEGKEEDVSAELIPQEEASGLRGWISTVYEKFASRQESTKFESLPDDNINEGAISDRAELGECQNDVLGKSVTIRGDPRNPVFSCNSPIAVSRSYPPASIFKYNSTRATSESDL